MKGSISPKRVNDIVINEVLDTVRQKKAGDTVNILEIGSGSGVFAETLNRELVKSGLRYKIQCADIEPEQINDRGIGIDCEFIDAQKAFQLEEQFDVIISVELIEHLENPFHFVREVAAHLQEEGVLILTSPNILSLRSRMRFFLTGCSDYFRRPYNEYWLNMGHVNPINPLQIIYALRKNGFEIRKVTSNTTSFESVMLSPLAMFICLFTGIHFLLREKGKRQKKRNIQTMKHILSPALLFGKTAIYRSVRKNDFIATPNVWHRPDPKFEP